MLGGTVLAPSRYYGAMPPNGPRRATLEEAEAARKANEDLFERMGAHAIEIAGSGSAHELIVHFATEPLPRMPATVRAPGRAEVPVRAKRSPG
jgi:hypothetical protein